MIQPAPVVCTTSSKCGSAQSFQIDGAHACSVCSRDLLGVAHCKAGYGVSGGSASISAMMGAADSAAHDRNVMLDESHSWNTSLTYRLLDELFYTTRDIHKAVAIVLLLS